MIKGEPCNFFRGIKYKNLSKFPSVFAKQIFLGLLYVNVAAFSTESNLDVNSSELSHVHIF